MLERIRNLETTHISILYFPTELYCSLNWNKNTSWNYLLKPLTIFFNLRKIPHAIPCFLQSFRIYWDKKIFSDNFFFFIWEIVKGRKEIRRSFQMLTYTIHDFSILSLWKLIYRISSYSFRPWIVSSHD